MITRRVIQFRLQQKLILFPSLLVIFTLILIPLTAPNAYMQEDLLIFQNPVISTPSNNYEISSDFDIRILHDGDLVRMKGTTVSGYPYYIYQKIIDGESTLFGKIFIDNKPLSIIHKAITIQEDKPIEIEEVEIETTPEIIIAVDHPSFAYYTYYYNIVAKVFDSEINSIGDFDSNSGVLSGINVEVILTDPNGDILDSFTGITDSQGKFYDSRLWGYGDTVGTYNVTVIADDGINQIVKQYETNYYGYHPFYVLND